MISKFNKVVISVVFGLCLGFPTAGASDPGPRTILFQANLGSVTFHHDRHQRLLREDCSRCHHPPAKKVTEACRNCHKKKMETRSGDPPAFFDVKMGLCRGCHRKERDAGKSTTAPIDCKGCHNVRELRNQ